MSQARRLVVNADDFGYSQDVNEGIVEAHKNGIVTATTLMPNGRAFEDAVKRAHETPSLDVGCHFVLIGGNAVLPPHRDFPTTVRGFVSALLTRRIAVYDELRAQLRRLLDAGIRPTHFDSHRHTHLLPPVLRAVARLSEEHDVRWIRRPFDFPLDGAPDGLSTTKKVISRSLEFVRRGLHGILENRRCRIPDNFAGFREGNPSESDELAAIIRALPEGITELMCHPGICGPELLASHTTLTESRQRELDALTKPEARELLVRRGIELVSYREL